MGSAEDVIRQVCKLNNVIPGADCIPVPPGFRATFSVIVTFNRGCRELNPAAVNAEVIALISDNFNVNTNENSYEESNEKSNAVNEFLHNHHTCRQYSI